MLTVPLLQVLRWWLTAGIARSVTCVSFVSISIVSKKKIETPTEPRTLFETHAIKQMNSWKKPTGFGSALLRHWCVWCSAADVEEH